MAKIVVKREENVSAGLYSVTESAAVGPLTSLLTPASASCFFTATVLNETHCANMVY